MSDQELKRALTKLGQKMMDWGEIPGIMGRKNSDGTVTVRVSGKPGWVHVRKGPDGRQGNTTARNDGAPFQANIPITMRWKNGILTVTGTEAQRAVYFGGGGTTGGVGPHTHRIGSGYEYYLEALRFEPGVVKPESLMTVYINPFRYLYNGTWTTWLGGTLDLTSNKPSNVGNHAWVMVGVDPSDNTAVSVTGDEYGYSTPLTIDLLDDIDFDDYIPCGAVRVRQDDTTLANMSRYQDAHGWFDSGSFNERNVSANTGSSYDIDWATGTFFELTLTGSPTFTFSNLAAGLFLTIELIQDGTGNRTVTWPGSVTWPAATAPTLSTGANDVDVITLYCRSDGSTVRGFTAGLDMG